MLYPNFCSVESSSYQHQVALALRDAGGRQKLLKKPAPLTVWGPGAGVGGGDLPRSNRQNQQKIADLPMIYTKIQGVKLML